MSVHFGNLTAQVAEDGLVTDEEILMLRRLGWADGAISRAEAEAIFAVNHAIAQPSAEWVDFFVEALREFLVYGTEPRGYVDEEEAAWLIDALDRDGRLETMAELELLVRVMERAENVPPSLREYVMEQIESAVLSGKGPTRCGGELSDTHITPAECNLLRRVVFAPASDGPAGASQKEAEMMFRLKDATLGHGNAPEWGLLFTDCVASYVQGFFHANAQIDHDRMVELETFMNNTTSSVGRFLGHMAKEIPQARNHLGMVFGRKERPGGAFEKRMAQGENLTQSESQWLDAMVQADGEVDELERSLLERLKTELS